MIHISQDLQDIADDLAGIKATSCSSGHLHPDKRDKMVKRLRFWADKIELTHALSMNLSLLRANEPNER